MKICMRTDASRAIGSGHVMRCLTLATELKAKGAEVAFICREHPGHLCDLIEAQGFKTHVLTCGGAFAEPAEVGNAHQIWLGATWEEDAEQSAVVLESLGPVDWLVVDHYALDWRWEQKLRKHARKIMVIDDLADRRHDCELVLDQNLYERLETRYELLVPPHCKKMLGPGYALLRQEFREARRSMKVRDGRVRQVLVFFGGSDPSNETAKCLEALTRIGRTDLAVDVVVGSSNPHASHIEARCARMTNVRFHKQIPTMARLMAAADLFIGAGGTTLWERCFLGLPSITLLIAENQVETAKAVAAIGATVNLGYASEVSVEKVEASIRELLANRAAVHAMSVNAQRLMDQATCSGGGSLIGEILGVQHA